MPNIQRLLVPIDGSDLADRSIAASVSLAAQLGAAIVGFIVEVGQKGPAARRLMGFLDDEATDNEALTEERALVLLAMVIIVVVAIPLFWSAITGTNTYRQGRSLYPAIVPISLFLLLGWRQLIPANWRNFGLLALTALLFLFDTMVLFSYIIPFFYSQL